MSFVSEGLWADVVEACYASAPEHVTWSERVVDACRRMLPAAPILAITGFTHTADCKRFEPLLVAGVPADAAASQWELLRREPTALRDLYYPPAIVTTHSRLEPSLSAGSLAYLRRSRELMGLSDCLGLLVHPSPGTVVVLFAGHRSPIALPRHTQTTLAQLALHLEAGLRIRLRPESVLGVLAPDGRLLHREHGAPPTDTLAESVKRVERARTRRYRRDVEQLALWPALTAGQVSIVERDDGGRRVYLVVENAPASRGLRAFSRSEVDVVSRAAKGLPSKLIAYGLGLSEPRVSTLLGSAASKIGAATRTELVRIAALLTRDPRAAFFDVPLTAAEREVLALLASGLSNAAIARIRNRSARTIANQVAELLRKTKSPTRRALAAHAAHAAHAASAQAARRREPRLTAAGRR